MEFLNPLRIPIVVGALSSLMACVILVVTRRWHGHLTLDSHPGVQKFHSDPTPRVGGLALILALCFSQVVASNGAMKILEAMTIAALPAFLFGLMEDITKKVGVRVRLFATMASGLLATGLTGYTINRVELPGIDQLLHISIFAWAFTAFCVGGLANAVNIIDGFNGLSAGVVIIALLSMGAIAFQAGDIELTKVCLLIAAITAGFLAVNFPFGKIFLGDGGAYLLGFLVAWVGVMLPMRNPGVSVWASFMAVGYPVIELVFTIIRRVRRAHNPGHPDRLHLHSLVNKRISRKTLAGQLSPVLTNSSVSPVMWAYAAIPAGFACVFFYDRNALLLGLAASTLLYSLIYKRIVRFGWSWLLPKVNGKGQHDHQ